MAEQTLPNSEGDENTGNSGPRRRRPRAASNNEADSAPNGKPAKPRAARGEPVHIEGYDDFPETPEDKLELLVTRDVKAAAKLLTREQGIALYKQRTAYMRTRTQLDQRANALGRRELPNTVLTWAADNFEKVQRLVDSTLAVYAAQQPICQWAIAQTGCGAVSAAGLFCLVEAHKSRTAGQLWRFAGLDPTRLWLKGDTADDLIARHIPRDGAVTVDALKKICVETGVNLKLETLLRHCWITHETSKRGPGDDDYVPTAQPADWLPDRKLLVKGLSRRPWSAALKTTMYQLSTSIVRSRAHGPSFYGDLYDNRKKYAAEINNRGGYADVAAAVLKRPKVPAYQRDMSKGVHDPLYVHLFTVAKSVAARAAKSAAKSEGRRVAPRNVVQAYPTAQDIMDLRTARRDGVAPAKRLIGFLDVFVAGGVDIMAHREPRGLPMIAPAHLNMQCLRWLSKMFLAHWHHVSWCLYNGQPPVFPYILTMDRGHTHLIQAPTGGPYQEQMMPTDEGRYASRPVTAPIGGVDDLVDVDDIPLGDDPTDEADDADAEVA